MVSAPTPASARPQRGFTLIEVLAATALFAVLGTMLFQMVQGGMDLWGRGERVRDGEERATAVLDLLTEDLRHLWCGSGGRGEQPARFLVQWLVDEEITTGVGPGCFAPERTVTRADIEAI